MPACSIARGGCLALWGTVFWQLHGQTVDVLEDFGQHANWEFSLAVVRRS